MALGRGLGAILEEVEEAYSKNLDEIDSLILDNAKAKIEDINVSLVVPNPYQPRKYFDENALRELSESIKQHGLLQPIVVIKKDNGYLLVAGERRLRAHKLANISIVRAIVVQVDIDNVKLRELALVENIQREDLNPIELANSYAELIEVHNITHDELSNIVHKSRSQITNTLRLLSLIPDVQEQLVNGKITQGHAKILVGLAPEKQKILLSTIIGQKLSVRETERIIKGYKQSAKPNDKKIPPFALNEYASLLKKLLPLKHKIKGNIIELEFSNKEEFTNFVEKLKKA
ncbi:MAG: ParB/RepB/Spo0J family partition protein [Campylobacterales bacterium]|nr:ParB/RepB/Spo0J family partition protein [Campylobacterales bacterium]